MVTAAVHYLDFRRVPPHAGQLHVVRAMRKNNLVLLSPGRRWGKSSCRRYVIVDQVMRRPGFVEGAFGAQSHAEATNCWEADRDMFGRANLIARGGKAVGNDDQRRFIDLVPIRFEEEHPDYVENKGARIWYPSLAPDCHQLFQGHHLDFGGIDEFSHTPFAAWEETLDPMLADTDGPCLVYGSPIPDGINFAGFGDLCRTGDPTSDTYVPGRVHFTGKSEENPHISHAAVARKRAALVSRGKAALAACLYDGRFVTDLGATFTNLDSVFVLQPRNGQEQPGLWVYRDAADGELVIIGIDFGRHDDATVCVAFSHSTMEQLAVLRIEKVDYPTQFPLIDKFVRRYARRMIWAEGREIMAADTLRQMYGDSCNLVRWTSAGAQSKIDAVTRGMDLFDRAAWKMMGAGPDKSLAWMREEFRVFAREKTPAGKWTYNAPEGKHDDAVAAVLYAAGGLPLAAAKPLDSRPSEARPPDPFTYRRKDEAAAAKNFVKRPFVLRRGA